MKSLILTLVFMLLTTAVSAQSNNVKDYAPVTLYKNIYYSVDMTSIERVSTGNIVFWTAATKVNSPVIVFLSSEVNCSTKKIRFRAAIGVGGGAFYAERKLTNWMPRPDKAGNDLILFICN